jgi:hypothetical protein
MPRLKPSKTEEMNRHTRAVLSEYLEMNGCHGAKDLPKFIDIAETTARARWRNPEDIKIGDIRQLTNLTDEQIIRMVRGRMPEKQAVNVYINGIKQ